MPPVYSVPKPRSCEHCAAAKARCEPQYGSTRCQRCNGKNIECVLREPTPRKRRKESINHASGDTAASSTTNIPATAAQITEVQRGVEYYRRSLAQWFPFVSIANFRQPAAEFATEKPFLSLVVAMLGCTDDRSRQRELALESRKWIATNVLLDGKKSLDILQGLLLVVHWYTFQWELPSQRNLFMHLAVSLIADLGLIKSPLAHQRLMTREEAAGAPGSRTILEHTLEQKRAMLGCLYLSSAIATTSLSIEAPAYFNTYAKQCYLELGESELLSDQRISHLCYFQHLLEQFLAAKLKLHQQRVPGVQPFLDSTTSRSADALDYAIYWDQRLAQKWTSIPENTKTPLLLEQYNYVRVHLHSCSLEPPLFSDSTTRLQALHVCISSLKALQAALLSLYEEIHTILDVPLHCFARANHSMSIALQLCSLRYGDVNAASVEKELQLRKMFQSVEEKVGELVAGTAKCAMPGYHLRLVPMARAIQQGVKARIDAAAAAEEEEGGRMVRSKENVEGVREDEGRGEIAGANMLDFGFLHQYLDTDDDLWLQQLLGEEE